MIVINKIDLLEGNEERIHELKGHFDPSAVFISVATGQGMDQLTHRLADMMVDRVARMALRIPQAQHDLISLLHREAKILSTEYEGNDVLLTAIIPHTLRHRFEAFVDPVSSTAPAEG